MHYFVYRSYLWNTPYIDIRVAIFVNGLVKVISTGSLKSQFQAHKTHVNTTIIFDTKVKVHPEMVQSVGWLVLRENLLLFFNNKYYRSEIVIRGIWTLL